MKTQAVIEFYGSALAAAEAAGVSPSAVSQWGEFVPPASAAILEKRSNGALEFDPAVYRKERGRLWTPKTGPHPTEHREVAA